MIGAACCVCGTAWAGLASWPKLLDAIKNDPSAASGREQFLKQARDAAGLEIVRRVYSYEDVGKHRSWLDGRAKALEPENRRVFALAMSDYGAGATLVRELPMLAAACRLTGERVFKERVIAQLQEMTAWSPLQRPGWTVYTNDRHLPKDGKDGNWLATGMLIRAIADSLEILPPEAVPPDLKGKLDALLAKEIKSIVDDWRTKRSWFIASDNAVTNQWVLPTEGLIRACLVLGKDQHREAYELGVANMLKALDAHGSHGEFEEGISYAQFTVGSMLATARAMAEAGDTRVLRHPFLQAFPTWAAHHMQPGDTLINCFDAVNAGPSTGLLRPIFASSAVCTGNPVAIWGLKHAGPSSYDLSILLSQALPAAEENAAPPLFAAYERATRVNWRSSWKDDATGIWIRGGHALDQHDHLDRGHVSFTLRGKPLLIEAGTSTYDNPIIDWCKSCEAHNVLQIGKGEAKHKPAPISVEKLDASGGRVTVDGTQCWDGLKKWQRRVEWSADSLIVNDEVELTDQGDTVTFRWHLATAADAVVEAKGDGFVVTWPDGRMELSGTPGVEVTTEKLFDNTLKRSADAEHKHTCVVVRSRERVREFGLRTKVMGK